MQPPSHSEQLKVAFPEEHVMLLTLNRPAVMNTMTPTLANDINRLLNWFDDQPSLWYVDRGITKPLYRLRSIDVSGSLL
jgi:hypothetical protein